MAVVITGFVVLVASGAVCAARVRKHQAAAKQHCNCNKFFHDFP